MDESWGILAGSAIVLGALAGPAAALALGWVMLVAQAIRGRFRWVPFVVMLVAVLTGAGRAWTMDADIPPPGLETSSGASGTVVTMPRPSGVYLAFHLRVGRLDTGDGQVGVEPFTARVTVAAGVKVSKGDKIDVAWSVSDLAGISPGYAQYLRANGVFATARAFDVEVVDQGPVLYRVVQDARDEIGDGFARVMPGDTGALATGIVTGDDSGLSEEAEEAFLRTGTSHITAVSGSNVAMVLAVWNLVIPAGRRRKSLAIQIVIVASIWLYALLTGLEPPATRAAAMASLMLFGARFGRRPDPMTLLAWTSAAMVMWNPRNVELISFWLSIVATAAIIMRVPTESDTGLGRAARGVVEGTMLAQLATLPLVLLTFGTWSLISVLANVLVAPLMWAAFPLCFLLAVILLLAPVLAPVVSWIPEILLTICLQLVKGLSDVTPQVSVARAGIAGAIAIGLPCLVVLMMMGRDGQRWLSAIVASGRERIGWLVVLGAGPVAGVLAAIVLVLSRR